MQTLAMISAGLTIFFAAWALLLPKLYQQARFTEIPVTPLGLSEIRAFAGGFMLLLGSSILWLDVQEGYAILGMAWLGMATARIVSIVADKNAQKFVFIAFIAELVLAALALAPTIFSLLGR